MATKGQPHLATQDAATVDPSKLTALTPEVVSWRKLCLSGSAGDLVLCGTLLIGAV